MSAPSCRAQSEAPVAANTLMNKADIGVGLEGLADWSRAKMFDDAMKTSRAWGRPDKPWENENTVKTDAQGWPLEDAGVVVIADVPDIAGTYRLSFEGRADLDKPNHQAKIANLKYNAATNISTAEVILPAGQTSLMLSFTGTQNGVKNVQLLRPGAKQSETFNADFLDKLAPFSTMRFMDFLATNNNPTTRWDERTTPAFASQANARGGALEYVVELANLTGKDIWVNVPDGADDDYARRMASLLKDGLLKNQKVYVEYSNEVWNWQFKQATRNLEAAKIEGRVADSPLAFDQSDNESYWAMRRIAQRGAEVGQIFREVFDDPDMIRVRPVYATQVGYEEVYKQGLAFAEHQYGQPNAVFYGLAGAPYFQISDELNKKADLTVNEIFAAIPADIERNLNSANTLGSYARFYGLHHLAYEGGQHLQDHIGAGNAEAKVAANRDARMGAAIATYLNQWQALGGETFVYFTLTSGYSKWGSWGLTDDVKRTSPKYDAALQVINGPAVPIVAGASVPGAIKAGDFVASNRWDERAVATVRIEPEKWMQYQIRVPASGAYALTAQVSSGEDATALVQLNSRESVILPVAKGAQSATVTLDLPAGLNTIRVRGERGRFDLQSLDFGKLP